MVRHERNALSTWSIAWDALSYLVGQNLRQWGFHSALRMRCQLLALALTAQVPLIFWSSSIIRCGSSPQGAGLTRNMRLLCSVRGLGQSPIEPFIRIWPPEHRAQMPTRYLPAGVFSYCRARSLFVPPWSTPRLDAPFRTTGGPHDRPIACGSSDCRRRCLSC
jgi:hypothetical protein